jgi:hypothetical protein
MAPAQVRHRPSIMKHKICYILISVYLVGGYLAVVIPAREREQLRNRAELHMLNTLKAGVSKMRYAGEPLPTNWASLSNSAELFDKVRGVCEYNHLPPPDEMYTILARKVINPLREGGFVFVVRSKPCKWGSQGNGRWVLVADPKAPMAFSGAGTSNDILRLWLPEDYLPPEIRSQLVNKP